jgi:hypothetical protein
MTCKILINSIGLLFGLIGSALIWMFGLPASIDRTGAVHIVTGRIANEEVALAKKYDFRSGIGFLLLVLSFLFQLISNFL